MLTFRELEKMPSTRSLVCGGANEWHGYLVADREIDSRTFEILRVAVGKYRSKNPWFPRDGDRFELIDDELRKP